MVTPHAQVYFCARAEALRHLERLRGEYAVTVIEREKWGIGDSRALIEEAYRTEAGGSERLLAILTSDLTLEAQNALLKVIEEPPVGTSIYFFLPPETSLLPTVRSRVYVVPLSGTVAEGTEYALWRQLPLKEQLSVIEARAKDKDVAWMDAIVEGALVRLRSEAPQYPAPLAEALSYALSRVGTRGAGNKMLLEEVALLFSRAEKLGYNDKK